MTDDGRTTLFFLAGIGIASSVGFTIFSLIVPSDVVAALGVCLIVVGVYNIVLARRWGPRLYNDWGASSSLWSFLGIRRITLMFVMLGASMIWGGALALIRSTGVHL
jgi:hypothetical protein